MVERNSQLSPGTPFLMIMATMRPTGRMTVRAVAQRRKKANLLF